MADKDLTKDFRITDGQLWEYTGQQPEVVIPDGVTEIAEYAFRNKSFIRTVKLPDGIRAIDRRSFENCTGLTSISMPDSITSVGEYAFTGCTGLRDVKLSSGLNLIDSGVFSGCSSLREIRIPQSVRTIEAGAFADCSGLDIAYISGKTYTIKCQLGQHPFNGSERVTIYTPSGSAAEKFARERNIPYVNIQNAPEVNFRFSSPASPTPEPKQEAKTEIKPQAAPTPKPVQKPKPAPPAEPAKPRPKPSAPPKPVQGKPSPAEERKKARAEDKKRKLEEKKRRAEEKDRRKELKKTEAAERKKAEAERRKAESERRQTDAESKQTTVEPKRSKGRTLEPGRKFMAMLLIAFLVGGVIMFVATRTFLKPEQNNAEYTLEEFISVSPDAKLQIQKSVEDTSVSVYVAGNELIYKFDLSDSEGMTEEAAKNSEVIASLEESLDSQDGKFIELCRSLEKDTGIKGISVKVLYTYGDEKLLSRTYTSNGKY